MPKARFLRTPGQAEAGPHSRFVAGEVYDLTERQFERWQRRGAVEVVVDEPAREWPVVFDAAPLPAIGDPITVNGIPHVVAAIIPGDDDRDTLAAELADTPTVGSSHTTPPERAIRHAGRGMYHVYSGDERLTERPVTRAEAEALAVGA